MEEARLMADNKIHIVVSKDGAAFTIREWEELLDEYDLDQIKQLYWQIFDSSGRTALNPYFKGRIIKAYQDRKKK
jgi:hypothetical protein